MRLTVAVVIMGGLIFLYGLQGTVDREVGECHTDAIPTVPTRAGDMVLFRTRTWRGRIVRALQLGSDDYAHAGIVVGDQSDILIAHASPGPPAIVRIDPLNRLLLSGDIRSTAFYRPRVPASEAAKAAAAAIRYAERRTPFDDEFCLTNDQAVYCTELLWRAYRTAGLRVSDQSSLLFPGELVRSGFFTLLPCGTTASVKPDGPNSTVAFPSTRTYVEQQILREVEKCNA